MSVNVALAWSGGKDSALVLDRLHAEGARAAILVQNVDRRTSRDRAHGVPDFVTAAQAAALGLTLTQFRTDWAGYGAGLEEVLRTARSERGVTAVAFGDIDQEEHRRWNEEIARQVGLEPLFPLWGQDHVRIVREVVDRGWRAVVVAVRPPLDASFLGRSLDEPTFVDDVVARGASAAGEGGEYHTLVIDGPLFKKRLDVVAYEARPADADAPGATWLDVGLAPC